MTTVMTAAPTRPVTCERAPAVSATAVRDPLVLTGNPWKKPAAMLAAPMPIISWLPRTRSPCLAANDDAVEGFELRQSSAPPARVGDLEIQLIAEYRGASLDGKVIRVGNRGSKRRTVAESELSPKNALAVAIANPVLEPGASTTVFVVGANGETPND